MGFFAGFILWISLSMVVGWAAARRGGFGFAWIAASLIFSPAIVFPIVLFVFYAKNTQNPVIQELEMIHRQLVILNQKFPEIKKPVFQPPPPIDLPPVAPVIQPKPRISPPPQPPPVDYLNLTDEEALAKIEEEEQRRQKDLRRPRQH